MSMASPMMGYNREIDTYMLAPWVVFEGFLYKDVICSNYMIDG